MSQFCQYEDHEESPIIGACLKVDCQYSRSYCHLCIIKHHIQHSDDLKTFKQLNEWTKLQMKTQEDLKTFLNKIIQLSEGLSKFLVSINVNQQIDFSQVSQQIMKDLINKLIIIQISKLSLIPLIQKLSNDLSNLKIEINKINQTQFNNAESIKIIQFKEQDIQEDQQIKQYINQIKQQQDLIQVQKEEIKQMKQLKQELEQLNQKIEKLKLENQKLKDQIEQQSNQLYFFQQQQQQYYPKKTNLSTPFLSSRNSSYQKVSFKFQGKLGIRIENDGKRAQDKGSFLTSGFVICEPSIPFNQNVKLAFLIIQNYYNIQLGICSKDKYGEMNSKYMTDDLASLQFYDNDTIVIDIRMKEKKLVFKKLRSSQHREIKIDTSQVLYPCVYLGSSSIIEIVDYN